MTRHDTKAIADRYFYEQCLRLGPIDVMPPMPVSLAPDQLQLSFLDSPEWNVHETLDFWARAVQAPTVRTPGSDHARPADEYYVTMQITYDTAVQRLDDGEDCI